MNIKNLSVGQEIKNYKILCEILDEEVKSGYSKIAQLKKFERYCKYHREKQKYIIDEIYKEIKPKEKNIWYKHFDSCHMSKELFNKCGVYKIIQDNKIYIGSTIKGFRARFLEHTYENNGQFVTKEMLDNEGYFEVIWVAPDDSTEFEIRQMENKYINYYKNNEDWICVNTGRAWVMKNVIKKLKYKTIKINKKDYNKVIELLLNNDIDFKESKRIKLNNDKEEF